MLSVEFELLCQNYGQFCHLFTMPVYQIWSCHVIQDGNLDIFLVCPDSTFNIRKNLVEKLSMSAKEPMGTPQLFLALMSCIHFAAEPIKIAENC